MDQSGNRRLFWDHPHESREHTVPLWGPPEGLWLFPEASPARKISMGLLSMLSFFTCAGNPVHAFKDGAERKTTFLDLQSATLIFGTTDCLACHVFPEQPCSTEPPVPLPAAARSTCGLGTGVLTPPLVGLSGGRSSSSNSSPPQCGERRL